MLLTVDVGNTNTVFAIWDGETWRSRWRLVTDGQRTADEYGVWLSQLLQLQSMDFAALTNMVISSVVPDTNFHLTQLARDYLNSEPLIIGSPNVKLGLKIRIDEPGSVGADRLANAIGAYIKYPGQSIVIDFGTATTFDLVEADGSYGGGIISPGINLSVEALHNAAAKLPNIAIEQPRTNSVIGQDTISAMQSGIYWGYIGLIEGLVARIKAERGQDLQVIATGGLAHLFSHGTDVIQHIDEDLTIDGLKEIYRRNSGAA